MLGVLTLLSTAVVSASDGELERGEQGAPPALGPEEALQVDAELIAKTEGISVAHARAALDHQERMDVLQEKIHDLNPEAYGGAVHAPLPEISTIIYVKGDVSKEARALVAQETLTIRDGSGPAGHQVLDVPEPSVEIKASVFSLRDMEDMSNRATDGLRQAGLTDFSTGANNRSGTIEIELSDADLERVRKTADEVVASLELPAQALGTTQIVRGPVFTDTHSYGGAQLTEGAINRCTSAFVVERISNGVDGVLTAEHCVSNPLTKYNGSYHIYHQGSALKSLGDAAWYTTTHNEYNQFYYTNCCRRTVTSLKNHLYMDVGDLVCRYGRVTGNGSGCKTIKQLFVSATSNNGTYSSLIRTHPSGSDSGDSGGPWYVGGTAWGIHKGTFDSNLDNSFSAVSIVDGNMGVRLRTS